MSETPKKNPDFTKEFVLSTSKGLWLVEGFEKWAEESTERWRTFKVALNLLVQKYPVPFILETGCIRQKGDYSAGYSTLLFAEFLSKLPQGGTLVSVDNVPEHIAFAAKVLHDGEYGYKGVTYSFVQEHSVKYLAERVAASVTYPSGPQLIYLDSQDADLKDERITKVAQEHQAEEVFYAMHLNPYLILLDDHDIPFGGKCKLARERLYNSGRYSLVFENMQSLWIRK